MSSPVVGQQGRIAECAECVGRVAVVQRLGQDLDPVVLHLSVIAVAVEGDQGSDGGEAETRERRADDGIRWHIEGQGVDAGDHGLGREDLVGGIGPVAVDVVVDPAIEIAPSGDGHVDGGGLTRNEERIEDHPVLVVIAVVVVAEGLRLGLAVDVRVPTGAQIEGVVEGVIGAVVGNQCRIAEGAGRVGRVTAIHFFGFEGEGQVDGLTRPDVPRRVDQLVPRAGGGIVADGENGVVVPVVERRLPAETSQRMHRFGLHFQPVDDGIDRRAALQEGLVERYGANVLPADRVPRKNICLGRIHPAFQQVLRPDVRGEGAGLVLPRPEYLAGNAVAARVHVGWNIGMDPQGKGDAVGRVRVIVLKPRTPDTYACDAAGFGALEVVGEDAVGEFRRDIDVDTRGGEIGHLLPFDECLRVLVGERGCCHQQEQQREGGCERTEHFNPPVVIMRHNEHRPLL